MALQKTYSSEKEIAEIWKLFRETREQMKETDRQMKEASQELKGIGQYIKAMSAENDKMKRETDRRIKYLDNLFKGQWGKLMETLVEGDLVKLLQKRGIKVETTTANVKGTYDGKYTEFDIIAYNGEEAVVVEVKTNLTVSDVNKFITKLEQFKKWRPEYKDKKIYGAVAYLKTSTNSNVYAGKKKLFVIRATGSSASITNAKNFKPKVFS